MNNLIRLVSFVVCSAVFSFFATELLEVDVYNGVREERAAVPNVREDASGPPRDRTDAPARSAHPKTFFTSVLSSSNEVSFSPS